MCLDVKGDVLPEVPLKSALSSDEKGIKIKRAALNTRFSDIKRVKR